MNRIAAFTSIATLALGIASAHAADIPGSKDPPFLKRFEGSEIVRYSVRSYDQYRVGMDTGVDHKFRKYEDIEGQVTRIVYHEPAGHTALELLRNYEQALDKVDLKRLYELPVGWDPDFLIAFWFQPWETNQGDFMTWMRYHQTAYIAERGVVNGQNVTVAVMVADFGADVSIGIPGRKEPVHFGPGELMVMVDVITSKVMENKMVQVKAADMADALATKGAVDIYGILFDVDKTDIKPESTKTLDEVANLLKIDRSLKLEIAGHTDNTGTADHNLKLSEGRARAVVDALVKKYGIGAARLQAKGYGDTKPLADNSTEAGKAKNRRVELRKM